MRESAAAAERIAPLPLVLVGLNHHTAPVEVRERLSVPESKLAMAVQSLAQLDGIDGACVISTCNRVEVIVSSGSETVVDRIIDWLATWSNTARELLEPHLRILCHQEVVDHLYRVASGVDSMIVGEPQIAGQVKKAFLASRDAGTIDPLLHRVYEQTMRVAKKVRSETGIGEHAVSVPYAAVELAKKIFGDLTGLRVLLLGAGDMGELTAEHLASHNVKQIFVANKTYERAVDLAERFHGEAVRFSSFESHLATCDVVIVSTAAPHVVITTDQVERALEARQHRGLFLIDLSMPRNIDPAIARIAGAYLYDLDDLQQVAAANRELREQKVALASAIIGRETETFRLSVAAHTAVPAIVELRSHLDQIRAAELEKCLRRLGPMTPAQHEAIEQLTLQLVNKILHHPIAQLKESSRAPREHESLQRTIRAIFGLT
ncbi:MAG: glutamyl-tRNA reductase [Acidobacteriota bacterium]|nr:glutamyl-tRNA reductase [Acidobacteriota bacterium]